MSERIVDILNEQGQVVSTESVEAAHAKDLLHRSIHVLVKNNAGQVYARQRPTNKPMYAGLWTSSVGTHTLKGDAAEETAKNGLQYFLGLDTPLQKLGEGRVHDAFENEIITVFTTSAESVPALNPAEGAQGKFFSLSEIEHMVAEKLTTPHLAAAIQLLK